jgi:hypothetical protein
MSNKLEIIEEGSDWSQQLLEAVTSGDDKEFSKKASAIGTGIIRRRLKESGFLRRIQPIVPVPDAKLQNTSNLDTNDEDLYVIDDIEPDQPGAVCVPFNATSTSHYYRGHRFATGFYKIATPEFVKNVHELRLSKSIDLTKFTVDNALKDMETAEDEKYIGMVDTIVGDVEGPNGEAGYQQNFDYATTGSDDLPASGPVFLYERADHTRYLRPHLENRSLNNGLWLMNRRTFSEYTIADRNTWGGDGAQESRVSGPASLSSTQWGIPHLQTIKNGLIADGEIYQFAENDFLGKGYYLKEPTLYTKRDKDIIRSYAEEILGVSIANLAAVNKVTVSVESQAPPTP